VIGLVLFLFAEPMLSVLGAEKIAPWWWLLVLGSAAGAVYEVLIMWGTRHRHYGIIARAQVVQAAMSEAIKIGLGLLSVQPLGLMIGQAVGYSGGTGRLLRLFQSDFSRLARRTTLYRIKIIARRYIGFPKFRLIAQIILVLSTQAPIFFTSAIYGVESTGNLGLAMMAVSIPFLLIGQAISRSYFGEIAHLALKAPQRIKSVFYGTLLQLLVISLVPSLILIFFGEPILTFFLGANWVVAGEMASILALMITPQLISSSLLRTFDVMDKHHQVLYLYIQRFALIACVYLTAYWLELDVLTTLWIYAIVTSLHYGIQLLAIIKTAKGWWT
jgi:O-antigen/teichoic acid export membrane protein